jgi:hypothetical protein
MPVDVEAIRTLWDSQPELAAQMIDAAMPDRLRPKWAADILETATSRLSRVPAAVKKVINLGRARPRWWWNPLRGAHAAFVAVRNLTLREERRKSHPPEYMGVLMVAECAAKVIYNASGATDFDVPAPFDEDSGEWLIRNLLWLKTQCDSTEFSLQCWSVLKRWLETAACEA